MSLSSLNLPERRSKLNKAISAPQYLAFQFLNIKTKALIAMFKLNLKEFDLKKKEERERDFPSKCIYVLEKYFLWNMCFYCRQDIYFRWDVTIKYVLNIYACA